METVFRFIKLLSQGSTAAEALGEALCALHVVLGAPSSCPSIINEAHILLLLFPSRAKAPVPSPRELNAEMRASGLLGWAALAPDGSWEAAAQPCLHPTVLAALAGRGCTVGAGDNSLLFLS